MDEAAYALAAAHELIARHEELVARSGGTTAAPNNRPPIYKTVGIMLAIASGVFIGISFVLKKVGLLKANDKYQEVAGEGYGYLKNAFWWTGMTLMIIGEICNFVAYAFVDAILVTPMGALSVVITAILSAIFLKERLSMVGKVGCFLCIVGSVVIVLNAPATSSAATIQEMQHFVISPGFLSYAGVVIVACVFIAFWVAPRYGKKSMLVYLSICSLIGGLSVVATQGLGAAIVTQIGGTKQYNQWFLYVLFVFVVCTLLTEIIYLNKALNLFNAALVTPTYYVFFTSSTIITSAILFRGFKGTPTAIITMVLGFFTICSGVVLLQLSKSAKDVPDTAVFAGDLDQVRTIAEQEQPESEPKADAIRGAAAIVRRFSQTRQKMEMQEAKRLHEEKAAHDLGTIGEDGQAVQFEFDGLRRRRTTFGTMPGSLRSRSTSQAFPAYSEQMPGTPIPATGTPVQHPPLGMSRMPDSDSEDDERPITGGSSVFGRAMSIMVPGRQRSTLGSNVSNARSPMHPVPLTEIAIPSVYKGDDPSSATNAYYGHDTAYKGAGDERHITIVEDDPRLGSRGSGLHPASAGPTPPPHSARRQFSFQHMFRRGQTNTPSQGDEITPPSRSPIIRMGMGQRKASVGSHHVKGATEEERLGLVKGDTRTEQPLPPYVEGGAVLEEEEWLTDPKHVDRELNSQQEQHSRARRDLTPPRSYGDREGRGGVIDDKAGLRESSEDYFRNQKMKWEQKEEVSPHSGTPRRRSPSPPPPPPPKHGGKGSFI